MRRTLIAALLVLGLLATPLALAQADAPSAKGEAKAAAAKAARDNRTANATHGNASHNKTHDGNDTHEGKPAWVSTFQAALKAIRESWKENASAIREECHAAEKPANNSSKDARLSWAQCIRDGYKTWFEHARAARAEARMARDA